MIAPNPLPDVVAAVPTAARTKNQIKAGAVSDGLAIKAKWKLLIADAKLVWAKLAPEELARVDGDFHRLAGLVQRHYRVSREEADLQTHAFFDRHYPKA